MIADVDVIELNHVHSLTESRDDFGHIEYRVTYVASYWVFWSWYGPPNEGLHVRDWIKFSPAHTLTWQDDVPGLIVPQRNGVVYIRGKFFRETKSLYDKEREDLRSLPAVDRRRIDGLGR